MESGKEYFGHPTSHSLEAQTGSNLEIGQMSEGISRDRQRDRLHTPESSPAMISVSLNQLHAIFGGERNREGTAIPTMNCASCFNSSITTTILQ